MILLFLTKGCRASSYISGVENSLSFQSGKIQLIAIYG